jgi:hypothetical protein
MLPGAFDVNCGIATEANELVYVSRLSHRAFTHDKQPSFGISKCCWACLTSNAIPTRHELFLDGFEASKNWNRPIPTLQVAAFKIFRLSCFKVC